MMTTALLVVAAYLLGSISSAILVCRIMGLPDPRTQGSNNPGATNVLRIGGKKAAAITLVGDCLKGLIPLLLAHGLNQEPAALAATGLPFAYFNVLEDPDIFDNLPRYADWPTFPQIYINGELVGGCDITLELHQSGELQKLMEAAINPTDA